MLKNNQRTDRCSHCIWARPDGGWNEKSFGLWHGWWYPWHLSSRNLRWIYHNFGHKRRLLSWWKRYWRTNYATLYRGIQIKVQYWSEKGSIEGLASKKMSRSKASINNQFRYSHWPGFYKWWLRLHNSIDKSSVWKFVLTDFPKVHDSIKISLLRFKPC